MVDILCLEPDLGFFGTNVEDHQRLLEDVAAVEMDIARAAARRIRPSCGQIWPEMERRRRGEARARR